MTDTLHDLIRRDLESLGFKHVGGGQYRGNCPWRPGANSKGFSVFLDPDDSDGKKGGWTDHSRNDSGGLIDYAERRSIEVPRAQAQETKRAYSGLADYAQAHYTPVEAFTAAGWSEGTHKGRPCLIYKLGGVLRYRMTDGNKPYYLWPDEGGGKAAWYGLKRAVDLADGRALILCNGEASTIAGQWRKLPACAWAGGEKKLPDAAITELKAAWSGTIILAYDCDETGKQAARDVAEQLTAAGFVVRVADLDMTTHGDLADFVGLHEAQSYAELDKRAVEYLPDLKALADAARAAEQTITAAQADPTEVAMKQIEQIERHAERAKEKISPVRVYELHELMDELLSPQANRRYLELPIPELATLVGPLEPELYVIYGAPNMGKSWVASSIAASLLRSGSGLVITTETKPKRFSARMVSYASRVPLNRVQEKTAAPEEQAAWVRMAQAFKGYENRVMDMSSPTGKQVVAAAKKARAEIGLDWLLVDSATRMRGSGDGIYERSSSVANALQDMARDLDIPVIVTSQIGRDVGNRGQGNHQPRMNDGYGSGVIEQNAGVVLGFYRHDYYVTQGLEVPDDATYPPNTARLILLKHRNRAFPAVPYVTVRAELGCGIYEYRPQMTNTTALIDRIAS